jgi:hypothetical protein
MKATLIFVYNANSGMFNALTDIAHKIFSPETYACNLCALTHSNFGVRREWKEFIESLDVPTEFLHSDELKDGFGLEGVELPAVFIKKGGEPELLIGSDDINSCRTMDELKRLILKRL